MHKMSYHNTSLYWKCKGPASLVPMQLTNKHLRISYVHEVNNNNTQLLSMSHTLSYIQCIVVFHTIILIAEWRMGVQTCSLAMFGSTQVAYFCWWLALVSLTLHTYLLLQWVCTKLCHLTLACVVKKKLIWGLRVYIRVFMHGKFYQTIFLSWG